MATASSKTPPTGSEEPRTSIRSYLESTVTPAIAEALGALESQDPPPDRPIEWLAKYLDEYKERNR